MCDFLLGKKCKILRERKKTKYFFKFKDKKNKKG